MRSWEMIGQGGRRIIRARGSGKHASDASGEGLGHGRGRRSGAIAEPPCRSFGGDWRLAVPFRLTETTSAYHNAPCVSWIEGKRRGAAASGAPVDRVAARNDPQRKPATRLALSFSFFYLLYL